MSSQTASSSPWLAIFIVGLLLGSIGYLYLGGDSDSNNTGNDNEDPDETIDEDTGDEQDDSNDNTDGVEDNTQLDNSTTNSSSGEQNQTIDDSTNSTTNSTDQTNNTQLPGDSGNSTSGNQTDNGTKDGEDGSQTNGTSNDTGSTDCPTGFKLVEGECVQEEEIDDDDDDDHGHDHGQDNNSQNPPPPPSPGLPPVDIPNVPPTMMPDAVGNLNISSFVHIPTNTTVNIDLETNGSPVVVNPPLPAGLTIDSNGHLVGNVTIPMRNYRVNFTFDGQDFETSFTFYDLTSDHDELTNDAVSEFSDLRTGGVVVPLIEASFGYGQDKSNDAMFSAAYHHGSRIVVAGGEGLLVNESSYNQQRAFDASISWACEDNSSVFVMTDALMVPDNTPLITNLTAMGHTVVQDFASSDCLVALGLGEISHPENLSSWFTGHRGAILMGHSQFISSVEDGGLFKSTYGSPMIFNFTSDSYEPMLNGLNAVRDVLTHGSTYTSEGLSMSTAKKLVVDMKPGFNNQIDMSSYSDEFMTTFGELIESSSWNVYSLQSPGNSAVPGENLRLRLKAAYAQNLPTDAGFIDVNAATYPGISAEPVTSITRTVNLSDTNIGNGRGADSNHCGHGRNVKVLPVYANAGTEVVVTSNASVLGQAVSVHIGIHCYNTAISNVGHGYAREPTMMVFKWLNDEETKITSSMGGLIMIGYPENFSLGEFQFTFANVSEAPYYNLGETNTTEWATQKQIATPWSVIESPHILLAMPTTMVVDWYDPSITMAFLDNGTEWMHWFHSEEDTWTRQTVWYTDLDINVMPGVWMLGVYPVRSGHNAIVPDLLNNNTTTAVHWSILHEVAHLHEPVSPAGMIEPWADFAVTAFYNMTYDLEIWETYKSLSTENTTRFILDSYFENGANGNLGQYSGSPGFAFFWYIAQEHGYDLFSDSIQSMSDAGVATNWDNWATHLCTNSQQDLAPLFQAMNITISQTAVNTCSAYPDWVDHPIRNTGTAAGDPNKE